jgi:O-antigen/teichoic acid export membrane protein
VIERRLRAPAAAVAYEPLLAAERLRRSLGQFRGYFTVVAGTGLTRVLALGTAVLLARVLGASAFGEVSVFLAFLGFWVGSDFLDHTFVRYANAPEGADPDAYLRAVFALKIALNVALLASSFPLSWALAVHVFDKPSLSTPIFAALVCGVGLNFLSLRAATHQAREEFGRFTATNGSFYVLTFLGVAAVLVISPRHELLAVYTTYLGAALLVGAYAVFKLKRSIAALRVDKQLVRSVASFAKWLFAAEYVYIVFQRLDVFLLTAFVSLVDVGQYGAGTRIAQLVALLTGTLAPALLPRAVKAARTPSATRAYLGVAATLSAAIGLFAALIWIAAPLLVETVFGQEYRGAASIVRIFLVGTVLSAIYTPIAQFFVVDGKPRHMFYLASLKLGVIACAGLVLVPMLRGDGAALAVTLSEAAALVYVGLALRHRVGAALRTSTAPAVPAPAKLSPPST